MPIPEVDPTAPASLAKRLITPPARTRAGRWTLMNVSRRIDPTLVRLSGGRISTLVFTPAPSAPPRSSTSPMRAA